MIVDFSKQNSASFWRPINDGVMGGISRSQLQYDSAGFAIFAGYVSFENNGGFASVRCQHGDFGRENVVAYLLEVCGDGKRYKLNLRTDNSFDNVNYQQRFDPPDGIWTTCRLPLTNFLPNWRGRLVSGVPPLDSGRVQQIGLMIADQQAGPFTLSIRSISVEIA